MRMTDKELRAEWMYRYQERLGILIDGDRDPTAEEDAAAKACADEWLARWRAEHEG